MQTWLSLLWGLVVLPALAPSSASGCQTPGLSSFTPSEAGGERNRFSGGYFNCDRDGGRGAPASGGGGLSFKAIPDLSVEKAESCVGPGPDAAGGEVAGVWTCRLGAGKGVWVTADVTVCWASGRGRSVCWEGGRQGGRPGLRVWTHGLRGQGDSRAGGVQGWGTVQMEPGSRRLSLRSAVMSRERGRQREL